MGHNESGYGEMNASIESGTLAFQSLESIARHHLCRLHLRNRLRLKVKRQGHDVCNDCQTKKVVVVVAEPSRKFLSMKVESTCAFPVSQSMRSGGLATSVRHVCVDFPFFLNYFCNATEVL